VTHLGAADQPDVRHPARPDESAGADVTTWQRVSAVVAGLVVLGIGLAVLVAPSLGGRSPGPLRVDLDGAASRTPDAPEGSDEPEAVDGSPAGEDGTGPSASADVEVVATTEVTHPTLWLCGPEAEDDACLGDLDATLVGEDGSRTVEPFTYAQDPAVDCFYVYPTVSEASARTAPLEVTDAERFVARAQAARFGEVCRVVAPIYRQVTRSGLLGAFRDPDARRIGYEDVVSAFNDHLASAGDRPFVLIGHSQGAHVLTQLVAERIEGDPELRGRLVSALLIGGEVEVPVGEDVGESFQLVPACRAADQTGCVVAYNSFAEEPPTGALFGRSRTDREILCVNPAAPAGGPAPLRPYLPTDDADEPFDTPFATAEDAITAECRTAGNASWLQVDVDPERDVRVSEAQLGNGPAWGLHTGDVSLALGDLVDLVRTQIASHGSTGD
jgi:hypothetical protein